MSYSVHFGHIVYILTPITFQGHSVTFTAQIWSGWLISSKFSQPFHSDTVGRCDGADVQGNQILTL